MRSSSQQLRAPLFLLQQACPASALYCIQPQTISDTSPDQPFDAGAGIRFIKVVESSFALDPLSPQHSKDSLYSSKRPTGETPIMDLKYSWTEQSLSVLVDDMDKELQQ